MAHKFLVLVALQALAGNAIDVALNIPSPGRVMQLVQRITYPPACQAVPLLISACEAAVPNFDNLSDVGQAECVCYNANQQWVPDRFDQYVKTCDAFLSTADPVLYSSFTVLEGFCRSVGNVLSSGASASTPATRTSATGSGSITRIPTTAAPTTTPTGSVVLATVPACSGAIGIVVSCSQNVPGFSAMGDASQAACLCYTSSTWVPNVFDKDIASCASYVRTAVPSAYSVYSVLSGYCSYEGDVLNGKGVTATTTKSSATTTPTTTTTPAPGPGTTVVVVTPSIARSSGGAGSNAVQGGAIQNLFLGFFGLVVGALAWL